MSKISEEALRVAVTQIGIHEQPHGSNDGPEIKAYLASAGLNKPNSWCASFAYWCFEQAAIVVKQANPLFKTGGVLNQWAHSVAYHTQHPPLAGDLFVLDHGHGLGHMGFVESVDAFGIHTIEGNSNTDGSRDGEAVVSNYRKFPIAHLVGYLRY